MAEMTEIRSYAKASARGLTQPPPSGLPPRRGWFEVHRPEFAAGPALGRGETAFRGCGGRATRLCARAGRGGRRKGWFLPRLPRPVPLPRRSSSPQAQMLQDGVGDLGRGGRSAQVRCAGDVRAPPSRVSSTAGRISAATSCAPPSALVHPITRRCRQLMGLQKADPSSNGPGRTHCALAFGWVLW